MATEPNPKIDELLRTYARQRQEGAGPPLELRPGTRQVLQDQVVRTYRHMGSKGRSYAWVLPNFWPRLLFGAGAVALLLIGAGLWLGYDQQRELKLAQNRQRDLAFFAPSAAQSGVANPEPTAVPDRYQSFELAGNDPKMPAAVAPAEPSQRADSKSTLSRALAESSSAPMQTASKDKLAAPSRKPLGESATHPIRSERFAKAEPSRDLALAADSLTLGLAATPAAATPAPQAAPQTLFVTASEAPRASEQELASAAASTVANQPSRPAKAVAAQGPSGQALRFEQIDSRNKYRHNFNSPPPPRVLTVFEVQRTGENVKVVDADGSVYAGVVDPQASSMRTALPPGSGLGFAANNQQTAAFNNTMPALARENAALPPFSFRAVGTNRTLKQIVVFTGEFAPTPSSGSQANQALSPASANSANNQARAVEFSQQLNQARSFSANLNRAAKTSELKGLAESNRLLMPGRIEGRASVGAKNEFRIEAQQVGP